MPFGAITIAHRLGISNCIYMDAVSFGQTVLRLQSGFPVYQLQLVHSTYNFPPASGPAKAAAEWCYNGYADSDFASPYVIREISAHNTQFGRRNLSDPPYPQWSFDSHRLDPAYPGQMYYLVNEADFGSQVQSNSGCDCWDPPDHTTLDNLVAGCFPTHADFWEPSPGYVTNQGACIPDPNASMERAKPDVLAYLYVYLKDRGETPPSSSHVVLPPSSSVAQLGRHNCNGGNIGAFWTAFFDALHPPGTIFAGNCSIEPIEPAALAALHVHHYTGDPTDYNPPYPPSSYVAFDAAHIKDGCEWYRERYLGGVNAKMPFDLLISEMGLWWDMEVPWKWSAGWPNFRQALTWWNTYLCWLTRLAPTECKLDLVAGKTVHALIHDPANRPYAAIVSGPPGQAPAGTNYLEPRNQDYLSVNSMQVETLYNAQTIAINSTAVSPPTYSGQHTYQDIILLTQNLISWQRNSWRTLPLGACFTVWARVGNDALTDNLDTGWLYTGNISRNTYTASVQVQPGFNTVFFPVIKDTGVFDPTTNPHIKLTWTRGDGVNIQHGYLALHDFEDKPATNISINLTCDPEDPPRLVTQPVYPAMVFPLVIYSHPDALLTLTLEKVNFSASNKVWLGRPIVLPGISSWFIEQ